MIEYKFSKKRSTNSHKEFVGKFINKNELIIQSQLHIDDSSWEINEHHIAIINHQLQWENKQGFDQDVKNYYDRIFKMIIFE